MTTLRVAESPEGSTRTSTPTWRLPSMNEEPSSGSRAFRPQPRVTGNCWAGSRASGTSSSSASKARVAMERGLTRHLLDHQLAVVEVDRPTASAAGARESPTPTTRWLQPEPPRGATPPGRPRPGTETSRPCEYCGWPGARPEAAGPRPSTRCAASSRLRPRSYGPTCGTSPSTKSSPWPAPISHTGRTDVTTVTKLTLRTLARRALSLEEG